MKGDNDFYWIHLHDERQFYVIPEFEFLKRDIVAYTPLVINTCIDQWLSHVMEMYIIARMLYNIEKGESKNITVYTGANHIYAINYFLKNYIAAQHTWKYDSEKEKSKEVRCVLIPQDIIQQHTS